jgi:hypothetical protein
VPLAGKPLPQLQREVILPHLKALAWPQADRWANCQGLFSAMLKTFRSTRPCNYYDHIIRRERELNAIRQYILHNPFK